MKDEKNKKKYRTVVIDPPWPVECISASAAKRMQYGKKLTMPYSTMTLQQIREFPINDFADKQCALFMWTTQGFLPAALDIVVKKWGFKFSKLLTWDKTVGINWLGFMTNCEFIIFAYRGKYPINVKPHGSIYTLFRARRTRHSEKPPLFYEMIRTSTPEPRIDIFARKRHYGFDAWGDQVEPMPPTIEQYITTQ